VTRHKHLISGNNAVQARAPIRPGVVTTAPTGTPDAKDVGKIVYEPLTGVYVANADEWILVGGRTPAGTTLLSKTDFSAVASASLAANTFSADYRHYRIRVEITQVSTTLTVNFRLRAAGADASGATDYDIGNTTAQSDSATVVVDSTSTSSGMLGVDLNATTDRAAMDFMLYAPQIATPTLWAGTTIVYNEAADTVGGVISGAHGLSTAYDALTILASTGNISGSIWVYGYADVVGAGSTVAPYTDEDARDALAAALTEGSNVTITVDDAADTITIAATGGGGSSSLTDILMLGGL
jgi:hypothetical protein